LFLFLLSKFCLVSIFITQVYLNFALNMLE
jgi:hypothetical protein